MKYMYCKGVKFQRWDSTKKKVQDVYVHSVAVYYCCCHCKHTSGWKFAVDQQKEVFIYPMMDIGVELLFDNVDPEWIKGCYQLYDDLAQCTGGGLPKQ